MGYRHAPVLDRFQAQHRIDLATGCWLWTAHKNSQGYGRITVSGRHELAHRVSYELHKGPIPDGLFVLHSCDIRHCVNPDHLRTGTHADNMADAVARSRFARGVKVGNARLTPEAVEHIRRREMKGYEYAALYGVCRAAISQAMRGKAWRYIPGAKTGRDHTLSGQKG